MKIKKATIIKIFASTSIVLPNFALARTVSNMLLDFGDLVATFIPIFFGFAVLVFFWGVTRYVFSAGDEKSQEAGRKIIVGGIIGIFIISSIWGIVAFLQSQFAFGPTDLVSEKPLVCVSGRLSSLTDIVCLFKEWIGLILPILTGLTVIVFFWGVSKYIYSSGNQKNVESGKNIIIWGIIGLSVVLSVWSIVIFLSSNLNFNKANTVRLLPE